MGEPERKVRREQVVTDARPSARARVDLILAEIDACLAEHGAK